MRVILRMRGRVYFLFFLPSVSVWWEAAICVLRRLNSKNSSSSFLRASSSLRFSSAWSFFNLSNLACNWNNQPERHWDHFEIWKWMKTFQKQKNLHLSRFPWAQLPFPSREERTFVAFRLLCSAIQPNDSSVSLRMFVEKIPEKHGVVIRDSVAHKVTSGGWPHYIPTRPTADIKSTYWLIIAVDIGESHLFQALLTVQLVVSGVSLLAHILHVCANEHFAELHKIAVILIFHCKK